jgi:hypothetical protein
MLLVMFFATWSGDADLINEALSLQSILANVSLTYFLAIAAGL